jgi:SAM-dependent methyltransferase
VSHAKTSVREFWDGASCGEELLLTDASKPGYEAQRAERYRLEPYIAEFANFGGSKGLRVLEIGVGLGADHQSYAEAGAELYGIDLTPRGVEHTRRRLSLFGLTSHLSVGDAEQLGFPDDFFDIVYSWGVLHHTPDTGKAFQEVLRVLKCGGCARLMIYSKWSLVGLMLWVRYGLLRGRPFMRLEEVYATYLESPGTKAYTIAGARQLCTGFRTVDIRTVLTHGDLLTSGAGQRHRGTILTVAKWLWPRAFFRIFTPHRGLFMLIEASK